MVVVVVGILAVVGAVVYRRHRATARTAEATQVTAGIRTAQEAYLAEKGVYASVSVDTSSLYPATSPGAFVTEWGGACTNCVGSDPDGWRKLAVHPGGPVMYGYATVAGVGGAALAATPPPPAAAPSMMAPAAAAGGGGSGGSGLAATDPYYVTVAWGDADADGVPCIVMSYSVSNQIVVQSEGE